MEALGAPDRHLLRFLVARLLAGLRDLARAAFYPKFLRPGNLFLDRDFALRAGFEKVR